MPRIRSLKPEIWHSHDMTKLSILGRLVFVILITQADDEGRQYGDAHHIAKVFLGNGRLASGVGAQLKLMRSSGMVVTYLDTSSRPVIAICNFGSHQRVDHLKPSRIQNPPEIRESSRRRAKRRESSGLIRSDQIGEERIYPPVAPQRKLQISERGVRGGEATHISETLARLGVG